MSWRYADGELIGEMLEMIEDKFIELGLSSKTRQLYWMSALKLKRFLEEINSKFCLSVLKMFIQKQIEYAKSVYLINIDIAFVNFVRVNIFKCKRENNFRYLKYKNNICNCLCEENFIVILSTVENLKSRALMFFAYFSGLKIEEIILLENKEIKVNRHKIIIQEKKILVVDKDYPQIIKSVLNYLESNRRKKFVFCGKNGKHLSLRTAKYILAQARKDSGWMGKLNYNMLRKIKVCEVAKCKRTLLREKYIYNKN